MVDLTTVHRDLTAFGSRYGGLHFAVSCLNTVLLLAILVL